MKTFQKKSHRGPIEEERRVSLRSEGRRLGAGQKCQAGSAERPQNGFAVEGSLHNNAGYEQ